MADLLLFPGGRRRDPAVEAWFAARSDARSGPLAAFVRPWFDAMRAAGPDVVELLHDGCPTACVGEAGYAYVNVFTSHANVGFFRGAELPDPARLLGGKGRLGRHVKLRPGVAVDEAALRTLVRAAYDNVKAHLDAG